MFYASASFFNENSFFQVKVPKEIVLLICFFLSKLYLFNILIFPQMGGQVI